MCRDTLTGVVVHQRYGLNWPCHAREMSSSIADKLFDRFGEVVRPSGGAIDPPQDGGGQTWLEPDFTRANATRAINQSSVWDREVLTEYTRAARTDLGTHE